MRLLIVEDERRLALSLARGLTAEGFAVDVVHDGAEGLHRAGESEYDLIVLDIMLPGMNGYRVCAALRAAGDETPVLMLTAKDGEYDEAEGLDTGADDYLTKPFSYVVLLARVRALLRRRDARRQDGAARRRRSAWTRRAGACRRGRAGSGADRQGVRGAGASRGARRARSSPRPRSWSTSGTSPTRATPNIVEVYVSALRRKLGRAAGSARCAAPDTGWSTRARVRRRGA